MVKTKKKHTILKWGGAGLLLLIIAGVIFMFTPTGQEFFFGEPSNPVCQDDPRNDDCVCDESLVKRKFGDNNACVPYELFIDPDDADFEEKAIDYYKDVLGAKCPTCNMAACPDPAEIRAFWGLEIGGDARLVANVECLLGKEPYPCTVTGENGASASCSTFSEVSRLMFYMDNGEVYRIATGDALNANCLMLNNFDGYDGGAFDVDSAASCSESDFGSQEDGFAAFCEVLEATENTALLEQYPVCG